MHVLNGNERLDLSLVFCCRGWSASGPVVKDYDIPGFSEQVVYLLNLEASFVKGEKYYDLLRRVRVKDA